MSFDSLNVEALVRKNSLETAVPGELVRAYEYILDIPSSNHNIRETLIEAFNEAFFHIDDSNLLKHISKTISAFHNSSLLIDDIEDNSAFRRGFPTAHTIFGVPSTINCANLVYFQTLEKAVKEFPLHCRLSSQQYNTSSDLGFQVLLVLSEEMLNLHHGQGFDIYWRDNIKSSNELPSIEQYLEMVMNKTGGLFRLSVRLLSLFSSNKSSSIAAFANLLGIIYQIRDDYLNLVDPRYYELKGHEGEDLIEGKLSLPILHCLRNSPSDSPVNKMLFGIETASLRREDTKLLRECIGYMRERSGSLKFAQDLLNSLYMMAKEKLHGELNVGEDSLLSKTITRLCSI